jgi:Co/Zn/Cd efflux system component
MSSNSNKTCLVAEGLCQENGYEFNEELQHEENDEDNRVDLNMCSAYTHIFADTLRSIAV